MDKYFSMAIKVSGSIPISMRERNFVYEKDRGLPAY